MRRLPRGSNLKCFTALVMYTARRSIPSLAQGAVKQLAGWPNEWPASQILLVAGLFTDQHQRRVARALPEHGLRCLLP